MRPQRTWLVLAEAANESRVCATFRAPVPAATGWAALTKGARELRRLCKGKARPTQWSIAVERAEEGPVEAPAPK